MTITKTITKDIDIFYGNSLKLLLSELVSSFQTQINTMYKILLSVPSINEKKKQ